MCSPLQIHDMARYSSWVILLNAADVYFDPVRIKVNQRFALKDAADAHKTLEARLTSGFTILTI